MEIVLKENCAMSNLICYGTRGLWAGSGVFAILLGQAVGNEALLLKILMMLSGIITILLSILLGGFVKHLAGHQQDRAIIFEGIENKMDRMDKKLDKCQTKTDCDVVHKAAAELLEQKVMYLELQIKAANEA